MTDIQLKSMTRNMLQLISRTMADHAGSSDMDPTTMVVALRGYADLIEAEIVAANYRAIDLAHFGATP